MCLLVLENQVEKEFYFGLALFTIGYFSVLLNYNFLLF